MHTVLGKKKQNKPYSPSNKMNEALAQQSDELSVFEYIFMEQQILRQIIASMHRQQAI